ncbi:MAG: CHRD domain-containing protein [Microcoleaceae cyanobacterium]
MTTYLLENFANLSLSMSESQEVPPVADGPASGEFDVILSDNFLTVGGIFEELSSPLFPVGDPDSEENPQSSIHIHLGAAGETGGIIRNLTVLEDDDSSGTFNGFFTLTDTEIQAAETDGLYVNLHTEDNQSGELRGQVILNDLELTNAFNLPMSETFEVPPIPDGPAEGAINVFLDGNNLQIEGTFSDLSSDLFLVGDEDSEGNSQSSIHLHQAAANSGGPIIRNFDVFDNGDGSGGFFGDFTLTEEEITAVESGNLYVNLHTENNNSGELRAQVLLNEGDPSEEILVTDLPITETQEVPPVENGPAVGGFTAVLSGNTLDISGRFVDLSSDLSPVGAPDAEGNAQSSVHIHSGEFGETGGILRNLTVLETEDDSGIFFGSFTLNSDEVATAESGGLYVNLHTEDNPSGELRGQIVLEEAEIVISQDDGDFNADNRDNNLFGSFGDNNIRGFAGDDSLNGLAGDDRIVGDEGNDSLIGANGNDTLFGNDGNDVLEGRPGFDILLGGNGNDILDGGIGRDRLNGGSGNDVLTGGASIDLFIYNTNNEFDAQDIGTDEITDFNSGQDRILLDLKTFMALDSDAGIGLSEDDFAVVSDENDAATSEAEIVYNSTNGALYYNANGSDNGFGIGAEFATLTGSPDITADDLQIR